MTKIKEEIINEPNAKNKSVKEKIRQLENQQKILLNRKADAERKSRTHRLIERGAILWNPSFPNFPEIVSHSRNNRQSKAVKNGMNLSISLFFINQAASSNCNKLSKDVGDSQPMAECGRTLL